jgi:hypothetical protein
MTLPALDRADRISFIGVAKNCGKTTALVAMLGHARALGLMPGLVSIGVDGEPHDLLIGTPKPTIPADEGQWLVSAADALTQSTARVELVRPLGWSGPMGEVVLARVISPGVVMLAGIRHMADLARAEAALAEVGARPVFIDGAYGRVAAAFAGDAAILATGVVLTTSPAELLQLTDDLIDRLTLPALPDVYAAQAAQAFATSHTVLIRANGSHRPAALPSALLALPRERAAWADEDLIAIAVPGLVSDRVLEELLAVPGRRDGQRRALLLTSGAALQGAARLWRRLERGWDLYVQTRVRILGVAVNPTSITGASIPHDALLPALRARHPDIAVFDPMRPDL